MHHTGLTREGGAQVLQAYTASQGAATPAVVTKTPVLPAIALPPVAVTTVTPVTVAPAVASVPAMAPAAPLVNSAAGPDVFPAGINGEKSTLKSGKSLPETFTVLCVLATVATEHLFGNAQTVCSALLLRQGCLPVASHG